MIMTVAIPLFMLLILLEIYLGRKRNIKVQELPDTINNLNIGVGNQVLGLLYKGVVFAAFYYVYEHLSLFSLPTNVFTVLACLFIYDFLFYWAHRWSHEVNVLWAAHVVHHQSDQYNLSVALRQPWFHHLMAFFIFLPLPLLGFDPILIGAVSLFSTLYQFWIHTKLIKKLPSWFEFIMNTPSHHRVHHAVNPKYLDKNHAAVFIIWDRLFGTFQNEEEEPVYGVTKQFQSLNPLYANYEHFVTMWKSAKNYDWRNKIKTLFKYPGWSPDSNTKPNEYPVDLSRSAYTPSSPIGFQLYALAQFAVIAWAVIAYINHFEEISTVYQFLFAGLIVISTVIVSGFLENKKWVYFAEFARLPLIAFTLNTYYYFMYIDWFTVMLITSIILFTGFVIWFSVSLKRNYRSILQL